MIRRLLYAWVLMFVVFPVTLRADEGMWIPLLIEKYNIRLMQEKGFKLSAEDIYSVNKACMKDAVLKFGSGCTGEIISGDGLLITNHHCGRSMVQSHSSLENDYLSKGFWAMSKKEELANPGLSVTILKRMEDVTDRVLSGTSDRMETSERDRIIATNIARLVSEATSGNSYKASIRPFYMGNQYFLFVDEVFTDVRLVGAPPVTIGNFGSETDNWIWPRHTGDFSLFRIYAGKDNKPADYSPDNEPYKPAYFFPISLKGVKEGDFTMVFGYPGTTYEYVPSYHIKMLRDYINPKLIDIRTRKIDIMEAAMESDPLIRIQYFVKKSGIANAWKKWQGELLGLKKMNTVGEKEQYEQKFTAWVNNNKERSAKYGQILPDYKEVYDSYGELRLVNDYTSEVLSDVESFRLAKNVRALAELYTNNASEETIENLRTAILSSAETTFKNYNADTDRKLFAAVMEMYGSNLDNKWLAPAYTRLKAETKGDFVASAEKIYSSSVFTSETRFNDFVKKFNKSSVKKIERDWIYSIAASASDMITTSVTPGLQELNSRIQQLNRVYMSAQMEFESDRMFYPDANSTLRVAYGNIAGYKAKDAVNYEFVTTLDGIIEKDNPEVFDYDVPDKLKELYIDKDYGRYATEEGKIPVCFIATNHTTGGNSGSPVIDSNGYLIGVNFDRAWEGVASDMDFNPEQSRNISLDIRYALFIIDKFAGAGYLLDEMKIIE
ncbi:MAG TPA: S46 family peptidase [Bacteroidales bacterium]|nr:S46 family peptidase [Bacteroidales bacterium]